jgi:hypothetical protein
LAPLLPIVHRFEPKVDPGRIADAQALAERLLEEQPGLAVNPALEPFVVRRLGADASLHLDDISGIPLVDRFHDVSFLEDRARLRAGQGDFVATCTPRNPDFERYCEQQLGLGSVKWLHVPPQADPKAVATACWVDAEVRRRLTTGLRAGRYAYLHPYVGNQAVWALAVLLSQASGRAVRVVAPHASLAKAVNDKNWFADVARRLLGAASVPKTYRAYNLAGLAEVVRYLAPSSRQVVIKIPDSAGGAGNVVVDTSETVERSPRRAKSELLRLIQPLRWDGGMPVMVSGWEADILQAVSCQLWIPPEPEQPPLIEAILEQVVERAVFYTGSCEADLPKEIRQEFIDKSWLLGFLFQRLGYVGRCSFDAIMVKEDARPGRIKLIECNGRWGGASIPMTLVNRLFPAARTRYASMQFSISGLEKLHFGDLLRHFTAELYDARSGKGHLILLCPNALRAASRVDVVVLGTDPGPSPKMAFTKYRSELERLAASA